MPKVWIDDKKRRAEAGVPEGLEFATKPELALEMLKEATAAEVGVQMGDRRLCIW
jgi:SRSO17 transposase